MKATRNQQRVMELVTQRLKEGKPINMGEIMIEAGYSESTSKVPKQLTNGPGWKELLDLYPDEPIMNAIYQDALSTDDKRNATTNRVLILKLKDKFPSTKYKIEGFEDEMKTLIVPDKKDPEETP